MDSLFQFWSFVVLGLILYAVGVAAKRALWTSKEGWRGFGRATMEVHPAIGGGLVGLVPGFPVPEFVEAGGWVASVLFCAGAGACSAWVYALVRGYFTSRRVPAPRE